MQLQVGDSVANQLVVYRTFEPALSQLIKEFAQKGYSFIDVGCNVGYFSCLFAKYASKEAAILAIDAHPQMVEAAKKNCLLGGFSFEVIHKAIGDKEGKVTLQWPDNAVSHASIGTFDKEVNSVNVEMTTLPLLLKERSMGKTVLKVDIEGYEIPLLRALDRPIDEIFFECVEENFTRCGFKMEEIFEMPSLKNYKFFGLSSKKGNIVPIKGTIPSHVDTIWARNRG
jgi:FkbM family methyltransferase